MARKSSFLDLTGFRFGSLEVLERAENDERGKMQWRCQCHCNRQKCLRVVVVKGQSLRAGDRKTCGIRILSRSDLPEAIDLYFWSKVEKTENCWLWKGSLLNHSYGSLWIDGKHIQTHRFSWILHKGAIPDGKCVLHKCDQPLCVNPSHLFLGSQQENIEDMTKKGRRRNVKSENVHTVKLTREQVAEIRRTYNPGVVTRDFLAQKFQVHPGTIGRILAGDSSTRKTWKGVE